MLKKTKDPHIFIQFAWGGSHKLNLAWRALRISVWDLQLAPLTTLLEDDPAGLVQMLGCSVPVSEYAGFARMMGDRTHTL